MLTYTGIGARKTPHKILTVMRDLGYVLAKNGAILRSGAAEGADSAFEEGADSAKGKKEIYEPWENFSKRSGSMPQQDNTRASQIAAKIHPAWAKLSHGGKKLHTRNCYQVLGANLNNPSDFLICWTPDGCEKKLERTSLTGGTATAIVLAEAYDVCVFNLNKRTAIQRLIAHLKQREVSVPTSLLEIENHQNALF